MQMLMKVNNARCFIIQTIYTYVDIDYIDYLLSD